MPVVKGNPKMFSTKKELVLNVALSVSWYGFTAVMYFMYALSPAMRNNHFLHKNSRIDI